MQGNWRPQLLLLAISGLLLFANLGATSLWDIDEPRNAGCAAEMHAHGEWIVPTFNGQLRSHKPVLLYWLMMSAYAVFGINEFAARFWSAALSVGTVLTTYHLGCRLFNRSVGLWAGVILASSLNFVVIGRAATPDAAFLFFTTLALALFARAALPKGDAVESASARRQPSWKDMAAVYLLMALAVLTKGPVGVVLPAAILLLWTLLRPVEQPAPMHGSTATMPLWQSIRQTFRWSQIVTTGWSLRPLMALAIMTIVALPWYVAVGLRTDGQWLAEFLGQHNIGRFLTPMENHRGPVYYYVIAVAVGFMPWSLLIGLTFWQQVQRVRQRHAWHDSYRFLACWVGVFFVFFSLATTKLPHYMIPIYPALALLTAATVQSLVTGESPELVRWLPVSASLLGLVGLGLLVGLPLAAQRYFPGDEWIGLAGLVPLCGGIVCLFYLRRRQITVVMRCFALCGIVLLAVLFGLLQLRIDRHQHSLDLVATLRQAGGDDAQVASFRFMRPSWAFYYGCPIADLTKPGEVSAFFSRHADPLLIVQESDLELIASDLPADAKKLASWPAFLKSGNVLVLGRNAAADRLAHSRAAALASEASGPARR